MKKTTDYYVLITENIVDEVIEYFKLHSHSCIIGLLIKFEYDNVESLYLSLSIEKDQTKLKWSELKRFIENSPTREKYRSVQNSVKGYKVQNSKLSLKTKKLVHMNSLLIQSNSDLRVKSDELKKYKNIINKIESVFNPIHIKEGEDLSDWVYNLAVRESELDIKNNSLKLANEKLRTKNTNLHNELLDAEKTIEALKKDNVMRQSLNDSNLKDLKECTTKLHELGYFEYWCDDLNTELQQKSKQIQDLSETIKYQNDKYDNFVYDSYQELKKEKNETKFFKYASIGLLVSLIAFAYSTFIL